MNEFESRQKPILTPNAGDNAHGDRVETALEQAWQASRALPPIGSDHQVDPMLAEYSGHRNNRAGLALAYEALSEVKDKLAGISVPDEAEISDRWKKFTDRTQAADNEVRQPRVGIETKPRETAGNVGRVSMDLLKIKHVSDNR